MATLREIIDYSKANPKTDYAKNAYQKITSGAFDAQAVKEGIDLSWAGRPLLTPERTAITQKAIKESEMATAEAEKVASPLGQAKEVGKSFLELLGFTPTAKRIAAAVAPAVVPTEELPGVVEELAGGVTGKRKMGELGELLTDLGVNKDIAETVATSIDLPVVSLGLGKGIARALEGQAIKNAPELAKLIAKPLSEFAPDAVKNILKTEVKLPKIETPGAKTADKLLNESKLLSQRIKTYVGEKTTSPQLKESAKRLFLEGTKDVEDPIKTYDSFLNQSKKALTDIKEEPAISNVGNKIGDAFNKVVQQRRSVGKVMGDELKSIGKVKSNVSDVQNSFSNSLRESDLVFDPKSKKLVAGKSSKLVGEDLAMVDKYRAELRKLGVNPTVEQIDSLIARATSDINYAKSAKGIIDTTPGERIIKKSLAELREKFNPDVTKNEKFRKYYNARKTYSELSDFVDEGAGHLGKITQSGDFAKDASLAKSSVQSVLNSGKKDWLVKLEGLTGYNALDESVLALQAMKDAGDFRGLSLLETLSDGAVPTSKSGFLQKAIDYALEKGAKVVSGTPEERTRAFLQELQGQVKKNDISPIITGVKEASGESALIQEAKKYSTAEEFVKAQTNAYHGTNREFINFDKATPIDGHGNSGAFGNGIYLTDKKDYAQKYADYAVKKSGGKGRIESANINLKNPFIIDKNTSLEEIKRLAESNADYSALHNPKSPGDTALNYIIDNPQKFADNLKARGYDGVIATLNHGNGDFKEINVFDKNAIKTKSQLTEIWNKAHNKK